MDDSQDAADEIPVATERRAWLRIASPEPIAAGFAAGAALARLDARVHAQPDFAGAFRSRMALLCAARAGLRRLADEATLRDRLYFAADDSDPGPEGRALQAWRLLTGAAAAENARAAAALFGLPATETLEARLGELRRALASPPADPPPVHAAKVALHVARDWPEAELLALYVADLALGRAMGWRAAVPLLAAGLPKRGAPLFSVPAPETIANVCLAYARAAAKACDVFAELDRAAARLAAVAPKLRSKQAHFVLRRLRDDDAAPGSMRIPGLTKRSARRLFDRLVSLGAVRELTGRETFRLYGL